MKARALIADDEPRARRTLAGFLSKTDWVEVAGETGDGAATVDAVERLRPDLLFLDVVMPGGDGVEVLRRLSHRPRIVFTTAFERYAVTAFELGAADYLLKPFGEERVRATLDRLRPVLQGGEGPAPVDPPSEGGGRLSRIFVRGKDSMLPVAVEAIERLEARDDYVLLHTGGRQLLISAGLSELLERLDGPRLLRVHRSHVVNLDFVAALEPYDGARLVVVMRNGARVRASRTGTRLLQRLVI